VLDIKARTSPAARFNVEMQMLDRVPRLELPSHLKRSPSWTAIRRVALLSAIWREKDRSRSAAGRAVGSLRSFEPVEELKMLTQTDIERERTSPAEGAGWITTAL